MQKTSIKNLCMLILTALIWGSAFVAQSVGMDYVEPFTFLAARSVIGGLVLIPVIPMLDLWKKKDGQAVEAPKTKEEKKVLLIGGICCGIALYAASAFQQFGISFTTVGKAGFITAMYIVLVPILGIFLKKKIGIKVAVSVVMAVIGLYLLCITDGFSLGLGDALVLVCAFLYSIHILVIDYFSPKVDGVRMSCIQFFTCGLLSIVCMLIWEEPTVANMLAAWKPILYAGVLSSGVAYTLQVVAQKNVNPTMASLVLSLESVFSVLAGWVILHQVLSGREIFGCVLMFTAIILAQLPERKQ